SRAVSNRRDTTGVPVTATVEHDILDAGLLCAFGDEFANLACLSGLVAVVAAQLRLHGRRRHERDALAVVDNLHEHVPSRTRHDETGANLRADNLLTQSRVATDACRGLALASG